LICWMDSNPDSRWGAWQTFVLMDVLKVHIIDLVILTELFY
jgi:hypothetical protein